MSKQDIIHQNAKKFNEDCVAFECKPAWEMVAPNIAQDNRTTNVQGFYTLQNEEQEKEDTTDALSHDNTRNTTDTIMLCNALYDNKCLIYF